MNTSQPRTELDPNLPMGQFTEIQPVHYNNGSQHIYGVDHETGKRVHLSHADVLANYGFTLEDARQTPNEEGGTNEETAQPEAELNPYTVLEEAQAKVAADQKRLNLAHARLKRRIDVHMAGQEVIEKMRANANYNPTAEDIVALEHYDHMEKLDRETGQEPITEDDVRYYRMFRDQEEAAKATQTASGSDHQPSGEPMPDAKGVDVKKSGESDIATALPEEITSRLSEEGDIATALLEEITSSLSDGKPLESGLVDAYVSQARAAIEGIADIDDADKKNMLAVLESIAKIYREQGGGTTLFDQDNVVTGATPEAKFGTLLDPFRAQIKAEFDKAQAEAGGRKLNAADFRSKPEVSAVLKEAKARITEGLETGIITREQAARLYESIFSEEVRAGTEIPRPKGRVRRIGKALVRAWRNATGQPAPSEPQRPQPEAGNHFTPRRQSPVPVNLGRTRVTTDNHGNLLDVRLIDASPEPTTPTSTEQELTVGGEVEVANPDGSKRQKLYIGRILVDTDSGDRIFALKNKLGQTVATTSEANLKNWMTAAERAAKQSAA